MYIQSNRRNTPGIWRDKSNADYTLEKNLNNLRNRGLNKKQNMALKEFSMGLEALDRFVKKEALRSIHECVFGVLAIESNPVDPRL